MDITRFFKILLFAALVTGCTAAPKKVTHSPDRATQLITRDLVNVLYQVNGLHPQRVVLSLPAKIEQQDPFARVLKETLQSVGYAFRTTVAGDNTLAVSYSISRSVDASSGAVLTHTVNIGDVSVRRTYQPQDDGWVTPLAAMQIRGADASRLSLNDDIFERGNKVEPEPVLEAKASTEFVPIPDESESTSASIAQPAPVIEAPKVIMERVPQTAASAAPQTITEPVVPPIEQRTTQPANQLLSIVTPKLASARQNQSLGSLSSLTSGQKSNVFDLGASNYAEILTPLGTLKEAVLTFDDDSTRLGSTNKARVNDFVNQFDPERERWFRSQRRRQGCQRP